ncbi:MAG TPA: hypothetical protein VFQ38_09475 [Longimicrobiales bacterium]|nr:hypothetical protein [Longimicrobiales bacterium]
MRRRIVRVLGLAVVAACVRTSTVELGAPHHYPPVPPERVQVFLEESDVPGPFEKIALISAEGPHGFTSEKDMVDKARKEAGKRGANGIIVQDITEPSAGAKVAAAVFGTSASRHGTVVAIRFTPPADTTRTP